MENEPKGTGDFDRTTPRNPVKPSKQPTGMIAVLPLLLLGGAWWLGTRGPEEKAVENSVSVAPVAPTSATPDAATQNLRPARLEILFPNDDAKLVRKTIEVPDVMLSSEIIAAKRNQLQETLVTRALQRLLKDAADYFPKGSALVGPIKVKGGVVEVNLNAAYTANAEGWSSAEATTRVMSIVNTAIATKQQIAGSESDSVRLLIDGKKVETLGPIDASEPLEADNSVVAKA